jgi:endonuclease/exonuclease/phosphatase family metal-dependent hydrolase
MLVRTWNLYHGNTDPPGRENHLEEMVRLAVADSPDVLCLQELPVWALRCLGEWSGMTALGEVSQPPRLGPFPSSAELGRRLTALDPGRLRSAFSGQGLGLLTRLDVLGRWRCVLNPRGFRRRTDVDLVTRLAWAKERRVCQAARLRLPDGQTAIVANLHATGGDRRVTAAEVSRAAAFAVGLAGPGEAVVLAGDFNSAPDLSAFGFDAPGKDIDHILVRGLPAKPQVAWPEARRGRGAVLLSDHPPVERDVG